MASGRFGAPAIGFPTPGIHLMKGASQQALRPKHPFEQALVFGEEPEQLFLCRSAGHLDVIYKYPIKTYMSTKPARKLAFK
jgi:hypothetical protein